MSTSLPDIGHVTTSQVDGLEIRFTRGGRSDGVPLLLTSPWPESIYAFRAIWPKIATRRRQTLLKKRERSRFREARLRPITSPSTDSTTMTTEPRVNVFNLRLRRLRKFR